MLFLKKNPRKKLTKQYEKKMEMAMHAMRRGDVQANALLVVEAEEIKAKIDLLD